jgi:hypothetical protein
MCHQLLQRITWEKTEIIEEETHIVNTWISILNKKTGSKHGDIKLNYLEETYSLVDLRPFNFT